MKSEVLTQLQQILGKDAEVFERVVKLLEKGTFSVQANTIDWHKNDFESLTLLLLERLEIALEQMEELSDNEKTYEIKYYFDREKFLNLATDLLRTKMITPRELEMALKNPEDSTLPWLLNSLRNEARELFSILVIGYPEKNANPVEQSELENLIVIAARKRVA